MKKISILIALTVSLLTSAQNVFPTASGTNVGIGTTSPSSRLELNSGTAGISGLKFTNFNQSHLFSPNEYLDGMSVPNNKTLTLDSTGNLIGANTGSIFYMSGYLNNSRFIGLSGYDFTITDGGIPSGTRSDPPVNSIFKVKSNGKVGIGTFNTFPTTAGSISLSNYKLFVQGGILTEEVRISLQSTWADYVFNKDYKLTPLNKVEDFIQKNGHLQNVPSAKEVKENGIELGEMAKIQQEKIEELTLYIIEQNKTNEKQTKEIEELKVLVKTLIEKNK
ncbi:hypothetical protein [Flavobacterium sp.]|uniref:hypothetical protein n=1 Tax=Flavobacterium sp. TaxID=239 RepID=UPI003751CCE3